MMPMSERARKTTKTTCWSLTPPSPEQLRIEREMEDAFWAALAAAKGKVSR